MQTSLSPQELSDISSMMPLLSIISTSFKSASPVNLQILEGALSRWPLSHRFPVLDVYRLACAAALQGPNEPATFALQAAQWSSPWPNNAEEAKTRSTLSLLALRAVSNVLSTSLNSSLTQVSPVLPTSYIRLAAHCSSLPADLV